jgi:hypothetical protein
MYHRIKDALPDDGVCLIIRKHAWTMMDDKLKKKIIRKAFPDLVVYNTAHLYRCFSLFKTLSPINKEISLFCQEKVRWRRKYPFNLDFDRDACGTKVMILDGHALDRKKAMDIFKRVFQQKIPCHKVLPYFQRNQDKVFSSTDTLLMQKLPLLKMSMWSWAGQCVAIYDPERLCFDVIHSDDCSKIAHSPCDEEKMILGIL